MERKCLQAGTYMILLAIFLRLVSIGAVSAFFERPAVLTTVLALQTGRWISGTKTEPVSVLPPQTAPTEAQPTETTPPQTQPAPTAPAPEEEAARLSFSVGDADLVEVNSLNGYQVDVAAMLETPLRWNLYGDAPTVLILHSHGTESYEKTEDYVESSQFRTKDTGYNVVSVGERLKGRLEAAGIQVIHDETMHDDPSFNNAYVEARESIQDYLEQYPSICLVLDIHRDAVESASGEQLSYTIAADGQSTAQLMMVVGTDAGGRNHPNWQTNMALAVKLHAVLEKQNPGICRAISFRTQRFNQDLSPGGMLIEVGAAGNTRQEALLAADKLAEGIIALAQGTENTLY